MSRLTEEDRSLIARHLALLRRHGWPAAKALGLIAAGLPAGEAQRELEAVAAALGRGDKPQAAADPFFALLAQGEAAGPEALLESVRGSQAAFAAQRSWRQAAMVISTLGLGCAVMGALAVSLIRSSQAALMDLGGALPAPTQLVYVLTDLVGYLGPLVLGALAAAAWLVPGSWLPGVRKYRLASRLRQTAAAIAAGVQGAAPEPFFEAPGLDLARLHRKLGEFLIARDGPESSARTLAGELEAEAALTSERFFGWSPVLGLVGLLVVALPVILAVFLPMFSLVGGTH